METRANYVLIGAVTIGVAVAAMIFALWIAAFQVNRAYASYVIVFDGPVRGLARGGEVRFQGIKVGEVTDLRIDPKDASKVLARVRVDASTPVRTDSIGQLEPVGLTGVNLIQLTNGVGQPFEQRMGQPPPRLKGEPSEIDKIVGAGASIAERTSRALLAIQDLLTEENVERVARILEDIESVTQTLNEQRVVVADARRSVRELGAAAAAVETLARDSNLQVTAVGGQAQVALQELTGASRAGRLALERADSAAEIVTEQSLPDFTAAVQDVRRLTEAVDSLSAQLQRNPAQFVAGAERPVVEVAP